jgi:hypothetical protein
MQQTAGPDHQPRSGPCPGPPQTRTGQAACDRRRTGTGPRAGIRRVRSRAHSAAVESLDMVSGPPGHRWIRLAWSPPQACRGGEARVAASAALRRSQGFQRGAERPGPHDQQRDSGYSASPCSSWLTRPASSRTVMTCLPRSAERATPGSRRLERSRDHEGVPRGTATRWKTRYAVRLTVPRRGGWRAWGAVRADFERALADAADPAIASAEIASELRRGVLQSVHSGARTALSVSVSEAAGRRPAPGCPARSPRRSRRCLRSPPC